jgi:hypothetical protein
MIFIGKEAFWSLFSILVSGIIALAIIGYQESKDKIDFKIVIEDEFNIVEPNEVIPDLKISYAGKDIIQDHEQFKVIVYTFKNLGKPILQENYSQLDSFSISFKDSEILKTEVVSSNSNYLKKNLLKNNSLVRDSIKPKQSYIELNKVIFERNEQITLKSHLLQSVDVGRTKLVLEGKISGIKDFVIIPKGNEESKPYNAISRGVYIGLIVLLILIILIRQITVKGLDEIFNIIKQDENLKMTISILQADIQKGSTGIQDKLSTKELSFFKSKNLIKSKKNGEFNWTKKGLELNERMSNTTNWDGELGPK